MHFPIVSQKFLPWTRDDAFVGIVGLIAVCCLFFPFWFFFQNGFVGMNLELQNVLYKYNRAPAPTKTTPIVIVGIDSQTLQDKDKGGLGRWQDFSRDSYVQVIKNLKTL